MHSGNVLQNGRSPLLVASQKGYLDEVKALIGAGANINQANEVSIHKCNTFTHSYTCMTSKPVINAYLCTVDSSHTACREWCVKGDDG